MTTLFAISADSHVTEPGDCYLDRIDPKFRDRAPVGDHATTTMGAVMHIDNGREPRALRDGRGGGAAGREDRPVRVRRLGRAARRRLGPEGAPRPSRTATASRSEVLYPSVGMLLCNHPRRRLQEGLLRRLQPVDRRVPERRRPSASIGVGQTALRSVEEGIDDLERIKELGLRGVMVPGIAACHRRAATTTTRAGTRSGAPPSSSACRCRSTSSRATTGSAAPQYRGPKMNSFLGIIRGCQDIIGTLIFGGVFERVPGAAGGVRRGRRRVGAALDVPRRPRLDRHRNWLGHAAMSRLPSEYFRENVYVTFQDDWVAFHVDAPR